jgi:hypothetical protein
VRLQPVAGDRVDVTVEIDEAGRDDQAAGIEPLRSLQAGADLGDPPGGDGDVGHGVEPAQRVDHPAVCDDEVSAHHSSSMIPRSPNPNDRPTARK